MSEYCSVTVVIPCFNCESTVRRALSSVAAQTLLPEKVILVDDCSQDETLTVLSEIQANYPNGWIEIIPMPVNVGPGSARNAGWDMATSDFIAFLDADDSWHPKKLEIQYEVMKADDSLQMSGHLGEIIRGGVTSSNLDLVGSCSWEIVSARHLLFFNRFLTRSVMIRSDVRGRFLELKKYSEDYLLWLDIAFGWGKVGVIQLPLACSYKKDYGEAGLSGRLWQMELGELDSLWRTFRAHDVRLYVFVAACMFSLVKFARRLVLTAIWRSNNILVGKA